LRDANHNPTPFRSLIIGDAKSMGRRRTLIAIFLTLAVTLLFAAGATAKRATVASSVSLDAVGNDGAVGHVLSDRRECRSQRRVSFYRVNSEQSVPSNEPVSVTWSARDGSWSVAPPLYPSEFVAVIDAKKTKRTVCTSATSNSVTWS
jgi:hypothetical protein